MPIMSLTLDLTGDWRTAKRGLERAPALIARVTKRAIRHEANFLQKQVVTGIRNQAPAGEAFKPLSPYTLAMRAFLRRRSTLALMERGDLISKVKVHDVDDRTVFMGVRQGAVNRDGQDLVKIAVINEFGSKGPVTVRMTPKMKQFLAMAFRKMMVPYKPGPARSSFTFTIPPRPFFGPVARKWFSSSPERVRDHMVKLLGGVFQGGP